MKSWSIAGMMVVLSIAAAPAFGQSLGELARQEEARRAATPKAKKSYSNADLGADAIVADAAPAAKPAVPGCYDSKTEKACVSGEEVVANSSAAAAKPPVADAPKEENYRSQAAAVRDELTRIQPEIEALAAQSVDAKLSADKRQLVTEQLNDKRVTLQRLQNRWARLEKQVKDLKIPHDWIEPVPLNAVGRQ